MRDILPVVVDGLWRQGAKNLAVRLVSAEGQPLPAWTPGAHIDLHLPCGLIRQYSLTGSPAERDHYLLCVAREAQSRGGSRYIHDTLRPGQPLLISAPRNHFPLHGAATWCSRRRDRHYAAAGDGPCAGGVRRQLYAALLRQPRAGGRLRHRDRQPAHRRNLPDPQLCRRAESAPAAGAGSGARRTPTPESILADRRGLWPRCATPRWRPAGRKRNCTAKRSSRPSRRRRRRRTAPSPSPSPPPGSWPVPGTKPSPGCCRSMALRCRSPARWGSAAPA